MNSLLQKNLRSGSCDSHVFWSVKLLKSSIFLNEVLSDGMIRYNDTEV